MKRRLYVLPFITEKGRACQKLTDINVHLFRFSSFDEEHKACFLMDHADMPGKGYQMHSLELREDPQ